MKKLDQVSRLLATESARVGELTAKLDRVRELADWHETKAMKARRFPGEGGEALMEKAAQVHDDAARRIREALDADGGEESLVPLPFVRVVGDLTNAHLGRHISYGTPGGDYGRPTGVYKGVIVDYPARDRLNMFVGGGYESGVPIDTPCEVIL